MPPHCLCARPGLPFTHMPPALASLSAGVPYVYGGREISIPPHSLGQQNPPILLPDSEGLLSAKACQATAQEGFWGRRHVHEGETGKGNEDRDTRDIRLRIIDIHIEAGEGSQAYTCLQETGTCGRSWQHGRIGGRNNPGIWNNYNNAIYFQRCVGWGGQAGGWQVAWGVCKHVKGGKGTKQRQKAASSNSPN